MAALYSRMLVSIRGVSVIKTACRPTSAPQNAKSLHAKPAMWTKSEPKFYDNPEYIPQRKAKNPMKKVAIAWAIGFPSGILLFLLAKREVDKKRLEQLKVRQRMKEANMGEYERVRYRTS